MQATFAVFRVFRSVVVGVPVCSADVRSYRARGGEDLKRFGSA